MEGLEWKPGEALTAENLNRRQRALFQSKLDVGGGEIDAFDGPSGGGSISIDPQRWIRAVKQISGTPDGDGFYNGEYYRWTKPDGLVKVGDCFIVDLDSL